MSHIIRAPVRAPASCGVTWGVVFVLRVGFTFKAAPFGRRARRQRVVWMDRDKLMAVGAHDDVRCVNAPSRLRPTDRRTSCFTTHDARLHALCSCSSRHKNPTTYRASRPD